MRWSGSTIGRRKSVIVADTGQALHPLGLGPEMRPLGLKFPPANPRRWPAARAAGLVWRPRAVPRTHGTREAPGPRSGGTTAALRGARCTIFGANAGDGNAAPGTEIATSGAPRGERVDRKTRGRASGIWMRLPPLRSPQLLGRREVRQARCPKISHNTGGGALAWHNGETRSRNNQPAAVRTGGVKARTGGAGAS